MPTAPLALALSPHLDDAVFSCGGTLARLAAAGWRVVVATLFTRTVADPTGFALACQLDKGLDASVDYMALRRDEDAEACARLGADTRWLPFAEAPHRGYETAAALFGPVSDADRIGDVLQPAILALLAEEQPALILAPQAIGGHVDHVVAVRALRALSPEVPVLWWRDYPYVARNGTVAAPFAVEMASMGEQAVDIGSEPKLAACAGYRSQLGFQFGGGDRLAAMLAEAGPSERFRCALPQEALPDLLFKGEFA